ncbi:unnamed protein product [Thlaspi arvense]|uniref:MATH domain-containing protein n=1 Tax=Thlaspi arvense TaxID=13288 RepID=A0AAU9RRE0_THLAR|nr:unnamed protein product [Thlaspi arvense]
MEDHKQTSFTFEIDNFSEKESVISSTTFVSGGCEWYVKVHPKGDHIDDHLSMYLCVANPESLRTVLPTVLRSVHTNGLAKGRASRYTSNPSRKRPKNQWVKTTYMNILLGLIETLNKPLHSFTEAEVSNAERDLIELTEAGFKLDWLKIKLDDVSLGRKKANADGFGVQELVQHINNLKIELNKEQTISAAKILSLEQTVSHLKDELNKKNP